MQKLERRWRGAVGFVYILSIDISAHGSAPTLDSNDYRTYRLIIMSVMKLEA